MSLTFNVLAQISPPFHNTLFYNNGEVYIDSGVIVQIYGNTLSTGSQSVLSNNGEMYVHFDSIFLLAQNGFTLDDFTNVLGSGYYEIEPDWTNNSPNFNAGQSMVNLMSDIDQKITGTEISTFYQLELSGNGSVGNERIKRMTIDAYILDSLSLNNRELATDSFSLFVQNTETTAITFSTTSNDRGFISSIKGDTREGRLFRRTANSLNPYIFPTGSSVNPPSGLPYIYRPVDILPKSNNINQYSVRFANESPNLESYDEFSLGDSVCSVNPLFYHLINHPSGFDPARVRIFYDPLQDDVYDHIAQWSTGVWNLDKTSILSSSGNFFVVRIPEVEIFSRDSLPFILADRIPGKPEIIGDPDVCSNSLAMLRAVGNTNFYNWGIPSGVDVLSGENNDTIILKVFDQSAYIGMSATSSTERCTEAADSFLLTVNPGPDANFTASTISAFTNELIEFRDSTMGSPVEWYWNFGDGSTAASPITKYKFTEVGEYTVVMYVMDENDCLDSTFKIINILEGIKVPNVFTPNGDGSNDLFYIPNSGIKEYHLQIFNRWGGVIFETTAPEIAWDGRSNTGSEVSEGIYYYVLEARSREKEYILKGHLTLFR